MPLEFNVLEHFHFLRPTWALLLIPWLAMVVIRSQQRDKQDMFGGIIAPHLLQHLRLQRFDTRWLNPKNFSLLFMVLVLLVLMVAVAVGVLLWLLWLLLVTVAL
jgi:Ca-activated chloride channel family protein